MEVVDHSMSVGQREGKPPSAKGISGPRFVEFVSKQERLRQEIASVLRL
jgi:hypothetical protein